MTESEISINVRLSCQRALLGAITSNVRLITIGWEELNLFHLRVYLSSSPSEAEIEEMEAVCAEIISDLPFEKDRVDCLVDLRERKELEILKCVVFARKE